MTTSNTDSIYKLAEKRRLILREMAIAEKLDKSPQFRILFKFYPVIADVKLYRKYYQTETFFYLDKILEEVANRMKQPLSVIRSMLPEEILMFFNGDIIDIDSIRKRIPACLYYDDGNEYVATDTLLVNEAKALLKKREGQYERGKYHGFPVSKGELTGRSVYYRRDGIAHKFHKNEIVLCEAVDPDMFDEILEAGAVLSVQGGVTSHAAIFFRENRIPAIGGISNLFDIKEQSWIHVDAFHGDVFVKDSDNYYPLGTKAQNLEWLKHSGFNVPDFFVESYACFLQALLGQNCKIFLDIVAKRFWTLLHVQIGQSCNDLAGYVIIQP